MDWLTDWELALKQAAEKERPILLDFFLPG
jgi:hypothetical protein